MVMPHASYGDHLGHVASFGAPSRHRNGPISGNSYGIEDNIASKPRRYVFCARGECLLIQGVTGWQLKSDAVGNQH